jgi:hypothetical protein
MAGLPEDLNELPADIQNYMRKLAEMDIFISGMEFNKIQLHDLSRFTIFSDYLKKLSSQNRGGQEGYHSICLYFVHNRRCFFRYT